MFGNNAWNNPQQNQQQQQQQQPGTSAFGQQQPGAFGSGGTGAFGTGTFGQTGQQPAVNPMFGGTTNPTGTTGATGFGSFGGTSTSAFGAPKPSGFGGFGGTGNTGTSAFGSGGAFGQTNPAGTSGTSAFGQPAGGTSAFGGTGGNLFGQKPAAPTGAFGSTSTGPAAGSGDASVAPVTTGSLNPPYSVYSEKDTNAPGNITLNYQSISTMPAYRGTSFEELRVQDYAQGRKTAGSFGQSATFGLQPSQSSTTAFGQPAGSTGAFGGFGQGNQQPGTQPTSTFGSFGQPASQQPSAFGSSTGATFGGFGQNAQQQPATTNPFGGTTAFGQNQQQQQQQPQAGTSAFGSFGQNTQPKPFGTFGSTTGTTGFGTGGAFGASTTQQPQQPQQNTGLFGQPANQTQGASPFGSFGTNNALKPAFGQPATQPSTTGFGLFSQNNQQQQQQQQQNQPQPQQPTGLFGTGTTTGTGLFGQPNQQQQQGATGQLPTQPSTGLFGQPATQPSTGLFGNTGTGTGLFGNNNANQTKPAFGASLFGNNQANAGTAQPSTGLFGQPLGQTNTQSAPGTTAFGGSSLFGQRPATTNVFGQSTSQPATTGFGSSLFGTSTLGGTAGPGQSSMGMGGQQGAGTLTASVAQPVQENLPIFSLLTSNMNASSLAAPPKKVSSLFVDVPTRSPLGISSARLSSTGKLRGFGVSQSAAGLTRNGGLSASMALSRNNANSLSLTRNDPKNLLGPGSFLGSPSLGSEGKSSPKKLVLHKRIDPSEVFGRSMAKAAALDGSKVSFSPAISMAAREKEMLSLPAVSKPTQPTTTGAVRPSRKSASQEKGISELEEGDYYVKPPLEVLRKLSNLELSAFEGLVVGRKGYGEVAFLDPVDLTALPRLKDLLGKLVEIDNQEVCVYPEAALVDNDKPPPGEGINVRARITLLACWPKDKATGEPLKDDRSPIFMKHLRRLQNMKRTHFESYDLQTGAWVFVVDHF